MFPLKALTPSPAIRAKLVALRGGGGFGAAKPTQLPYRRREESDDAKIVVVGYADVLEKKIMTILQFIFCT